MTSTQFQDKEITMEKAVKLANEIVRMEAAIKSMKEQLKAFVDQNGSFIAGDQVWAYSESVSWSFKDTSLKELATMIALEGHNVWEMLSLPSAALKKLGWQEDFLSKYGEKKVTKRFSSKKK